MNTATENIDSPETESAPELEQESAPEIVVPSEPTTGARLCAKCSKVLEMSESVCGGCGYYETAGIFVDLEEETEDEGQAPFPWKVFFIPFAMTGVIVESLVLTHLTHPQSPDRRLCSWSHLGLGLCLFLVPHIRAHIRSMKDDSSTGIMGFLFRPLHIWRLDVRELPKSLPWMMSACVGFTAIFCSLFIVRGLPSPFRKIDIEKERQKIVVEMPASEGNDSGSLEEALADVGESVEIDDAEEDEEIVDEADREYLDCVIIGFNVSPENPDSVYSLVVATQKLDRLTVVGNVSNRIPEAIRFKLMAHLAPIRTRIPAAKSPYRAIWVKPKYRCRVWHKKPDEEQQDANVPVRMVFDRMLVMKAS